MKKFPLINAVFNFLLLLEKVAKSPMRLERAGGKV